MALLQPVAIPNVHAYPDVPSDAYEIGQVFVKDTTGRTHTADVPNSSMPVKGLQSMVFQLIGAYMQ